MVTKRRSRSRSPSGGDPERDVRRPVGRELALLAVLCGAQVLEVLGVTVVIVALPVIGTELALSEGRLQLVVSLYAVLYGGLLLTSGRVADVLGRRSVLAVGLLVTAIGAVTAALAPSGTVLLLGRAVQGLGGALVTPSALALLTGAFPEGRPRRLAAALALLTGAFPEGRPRRLAVSAWTAAAAGGGALGFGAGGVLVAVASWRAVFWLLGGVAVVLFALLWTVVPAPTRSGRRPGRGVDLPGTVTAVVGLVLLVVGAGLVSDPGPGAAVVLGAGAVFLVAFVITQRVGRDPLLGWATLTDRRFLLANGVAFTNTATTAASGTLVSLVAADVLGLGPAATGLALLPFSLMVVLGSLAGGFWLSRSRHWGMAVGLAVVAAAMAGLAVATAGRSVPLLVGALAVAGVGLSWAAVTSTDAATAALPATRQGTAAGAVNTAAQVGTALGVAGLLAVVSLVSGRAGPVGPGYVVAFVAAAVAAGGVALVVLVRGRVVLDGSARPP